MKNPNGTIENRTRELVAQCLNQLRSRVSDILHYGLETFYYIQRFTE